MIQFKQRFQTLALAATALGIAFCATAPAIAQTTEFPNKTIKIVIGFTPGGATDTIGRQIAISFSKILGQSVIVENRPGANGNLATDAVRRSPPDGYTLFYTSIGHVTNPLIYPDAKYDPIKDFTPIGQILSGPNILVVPANSKFKTVKDLLDYARANPGKVNWASSGIGSSLHLSGLLFMQLSGVDMLHIPYKGAGSLMPHLLAGTVDLAFPNLPTGAKLVDQGLLQALGVTTKTRSSAAPNIPSIAEAGIPGYDMSTWYGLVGPANMPAAVLQLLSKAAVQTVNEPEFKERLIAQGFDPKGSSPEEFSAFIQAESVRWGAILKEMKIKIE